MIKEKDIKWISKQFKESSKSFMDFKRVYFGFIKSDKKEVLYSEVKNMYMLEEDLRKLVIKNLKKVYSGKTDIKIFTPSFLEKPKNTDESFYSVINEIESGNNDFKELSDKIAFKIAESRSFENNIVLILSECNIFKEGVKRNLIVGTICKTKLGDVNFLFKGNIIDDNEEDNKFMLQSSLDANINLSSPIEGFSYPILTDATAIKEELLYYSNKSNNINSVLVSKVFECDVKLTAKQEEIFFNSIINEVLGGNISPKNLFKLYNSLDIFDEDVEEDEKVVDRFEIDKSLKKLGIEQKMTTEEAFEKIFGFNNYEFKINNILPNKEKKSIYIKNEDADIKLKPESLQSLKKIQAEDGQVYLLVPMNDDISTNGFSLPTEKLDI